MNTPRLASMLLLSTALVAAPSLAHAQDASADPAATAADSAPTTEDQSSDEQAPDISIPGGAIIVTGRRASPNVQRVSTEVVSVLSSEEIARTGEGDIAGALSRVTGLSVVGNGYVYVRGLGDRYSLALLNGSPLPSPEPLKRVVPLDIFPSSVIASSLVQKSFSVNFPGEFGGGVINLTTKAIPDKPFLKIGGGISGNTETTGNLSYSYYGSKSDWTGFDNGVRDIPASLQAYFDGKANLSANSPDNRLITSQLINANNAVVQTIKHTAPDFSADLSAGTAWDLGTTRMGVIAAASYSHKWETRDAINQIALGDDINSLERNQRNVQTNEHMLVNGLLGLGIEFGDNSIRWTNLYIRDTIKHASLAYGQNNGSAVPDTNFFDQETAWYERQLIDTQLVGEFKPEPDTTVNLRAGYANSQREAPFEIASEYIEANGQLYNLLNGNQGSASVTFSDLNEDLWSAGADLTHRFGPDWTITVGYAFQHANRDSSRRSLTFKSTSSSFDPAFQQLRLDELLSPQVIYLYDTLASTGALTPEQLAHFPRINVAEESPDGSIFQASLLNHAWYSKIDAQLTSELQLDAGVRWEWARETTRVIPIAGSTTTNISPTEINKAYWLPAATLTWQFNPEMQVRLSASKTIGRPQFRELQYQPFYDPESGRTYKGNPKLTDSQLYNAEARFEWYMNRSDHLAVGAFFKRIDNPVEAYVDAQYIINYANAPKANLYGAEAEFQKYFDMFAARRLRVGLNYTYSKSELKVSAGDTTLVGGTNTIQLASNYFQDGSPLTGQSKHMANLEIGLEDQDSLSQQTLLLNYSSKRIVSRGPRDYPYDIYENPGFTLDFVARQGIELAGKQIELKFQARNLTNRKHEEYQDLPSGRIQTNTYDVGRTFSLSASLNF
jgi:TonB-dependent receptor